MQPLAPIVLLFGLILYFWPNVPAKVTRVGEIMVWLGLGFTLWFYGGKL